MCTGKLKVAPLRFGADAQGDYLNSDFTFALIDFDPATAFTYGDAALFADVADVADDDADAA